MSHIVTIKTQVREVAAIVAACQRLQLPPPVHGTAQLFAGQTATGQLVQLPGWRFPVVCELSTGELKFDHFGGRWGSPTELERFLQAYAVERARLAARQRGHTVIEQRLGDGAIKLTIQVSGGTA